MNALAPASGVPQLGKYELLEEIGHGGMATVYRARDRRLGREVAVKVIHKHLRENDEVGTRFIAEARAAAKLRHPGIVEVFDVSSESDGERFLVAELLRGSTLRKLLLQHRQMPAEIGAAIVLSLCEALEHAHAAAIIHRDIKPENVLVELPTDREKSPAGIPPAADSGPGLRSNDPRDKPEESSVVRLLGAASSPEIHARASDPLRESERSRRSQPDREGSRKIRAATKGVVIKLTDFGIAKILDAQSVTSTGQVLGSPAHMAPEQIEGGEVDSRTDVFGLGVLMYECLVGHLPFEGKNPAQVLRKVLDGTFSQADRERPAVGGRWARIVAQALCRDAALRTATPALLGEQIRGELEALGVTDPPAEINAYFADASGYAAAHVQRLVPILLARAEEARKAGDVQGAAADCNRALAFCPNDLSIVKRISSLHRAAGKRLLVQRAGAIVAGSVALGCAAFGIARALKVRGSERAEGSPAESLTAAAAPFAPSPPVAGLSAMPGVADGRASPSASPASSVVATRPRGTPVVVPSPLPPPAMPPGVRTVKFLLSPLGAKLLVDGQPINWFGGTVTLSPGPHQVTAFMEGSKCCKNLEASVHVQPPPAASPELIQNIPLPLEILPATVTLAGAPPNGQFVCPRINLSGFAGATMKIKLNEPVWSGNCQFSTSIDKPARVSGVVIRAGEMTPIPWPID
jgi:serine/threonine protein kinase